MLSVLCREYHWTPDYILKEMTWNQVMLFYEHILAYLGGQSVIYDDPPPLEIPGTQINKKGHRVYNK